MRWFHWLRIHLLPLSYVATQRRVDALDHALAELRAEVAALPAQQRAARAKDIQALIAAQANAHNMLSDTLDDRAKR